MLDRDLRGRLIKVAQRRDTISYSELRPEAPQTLALPLDEINKYELRAGKPLLSAVVIHKDTDRMPGDGFFRIAWEMGQYKEGEPEEYWRQELERVWNYWADGRWHHPSCRPPGIHERTG